MFSYKLAKPAFILAGITAMVMTTTTGCTSGVEQGSIDNSDVDYQVEDKPIDIIAEESVELFLGDVATLSGRIVGHPVGDRTVLWVQTAGPEVTLDAGYSWDMETIAFTTPASADEGIITYRFELQGLDASGNIDVGSDGEELRAESAVVAFDKERVLTFEVEGEFATLTGGASLVGPGDEHYIKGASGQMTADLTPGQGVDFEFDISSENAGFYALSVRYGIGLGYGGKEAVITVNDVPTTVMLTTEGQIDELKVGTFKFDAGTHSVRVADGWNWYRMDSLLLAPAAAPAEPLPVPPAPINEVATQEAVDLKAYLAEQYIQGILSGQQQAIYDGSNVMEEHNKIIKASGATPAIYSFDYMDYSATRAANGSLNTGLTEDMIALRSRGTILSAMWHWNAPMDLIDSEEQPWYKGFYTEATTFDLPTALSDEMSDERAALMVDLAIIADELEMLQSAGIPVLWRPIHEAEGGWFWWGAHGAENFKSLWQLMYDYFTVDRELNNLLWVYSAAADASAEWYPGDAYVDIVGYDGYDGSASGEDNIFKAQWDTLLAQHNSKKMIALTETGFVPDAQAMADANTWWSFFITWNSSDEWGPDSSTKIDQRYNAGVVINAGDLPGKISGGESPTTAGSYENFDRTDIFAAQINWRSMPHVAVATKGTWAASGFNALEATADLAAAEALLDGPANSVIIQTWTEHDGSNASTLKVTVSAQNAGSDITAKLWAKDANSIWLDGGAVAINAEGTVLTLDISDSAFDTVSSFGVEFKGLDASRSAAKFYIDDVIWVDAEGAETTLANFEIAEGFEGQMDWATQPGIGVNDRWSANGGRSMGYRADLSAKTNWGDSPSVVIQSYPEDGIDVTGISMVSLSAASLNAGAGATGKLFVKDAAGMWKDGGAVDLSSGALLSVDVSALDSLSGLGVEFENLDLASSDAEFYIDHIQLDGTVYADFELLSGWESQADWTSVDAASISDVWGVSGTNALTMQMDLSAKTNWGKNPSVVLQSYPQINIAGVDTLQLVAHSSGAGSSVTGKLFIKHGDKLETADAGSIVLSEQGTVLSIDVSEYAFIAGLGVQFEALDLTATDAHFYIDSVEFTAPPVAP